MLAASLLLSACATVASNPTVACPTPVIAYDEKTRQQAASEYEALPPGGLRTLADDYAATRAALRVFCGAPQ
jgi:outer membrane biogenesis lipoprotein LolB